MGGIQLAAEKLCIFERARSLDGKGLQNSDSLTELIDFLSPASLMDLLTMFGELGAVAEGPQFALELCLINCGWRDGFGTSLG